VRVGHYLDREQVNGPNGGFYPLHFLIPSKRRKPVKNQGCLLEGLGVFPLVVKVTFNRGGDLYPHAWLFSFFFFGFFFVFAIRGLGSFFSSRSLTLLGHFETRIFPVFGFADYGYLSHAFLVQ